MAATRNVPKLRAAAAAVALAAALVLALALPGPVLPAAPAKGGDPVAIPGSEVRPARAVVPPIDAAVPARIETATFALG